MRIAVIGSGVSGLVAAWLLQSDQNQITLIEKSDTPGGHARTLRVCEGEREIAVDTGFIVFNKENYPLLTALFDQLQVPVKPSSMSFAVSLKGGSVEYATVPVWRLFSPLRNLFSFKHWQMLRDMFRFNREARSLPIESTLSIGEFLDRGGYSQAFCERYLLPMAASIWSTAITQVREFPARTLVDFFNNHGLMNPEKKRQWYTVDGGSREYVNRLLQAFSGDLVLGKGVTSLRRLTKGVELQFEDGSVELFDQVVMACHSDQALRILGDAATADERSLLSQIRYQPNRVVLHSDESFMPRNKRCWQSWVYLQETRADGSPAVSMSYWMNNLQSLQSERPLIVTLNPERQPDPQLTHDLWDTAHPLFDQSAITAQRELANIQGVDRVWYCGAWTAFGFHEDGARSAYQVASMLREREFAMVEQAA